ncbi:hypothetical protein BWI97_21390 [Siphonobacter sp. BAB-5405]|nr:hypothetical protein BWI97_21390 [Siphonobacter sp. BAB-5405]
MKETITSVTEKMNVPIKPLFNFLAAESVKQRFISPFNHKYFRSNQNKIRTFWDILLFIFKRSFT